MSDPTESRVRDLCLALPEAHEQETWGHPTFRVRKKIFLIYSQAEHHEDGQPRVSLKAAQGCQQILLDRGDPFFYPPYVGSKGWIGVALGPDLDWLEFGDLVQDSYREIAPKTLVRALEDESRRG